MDDTALKQLSDWLGQALGQQVTVTAAGKLTGGAIQENWLITTDVAGDLVLRTDAPSGVATSHSREQEFTLLKVAQEAGVTVPEPLAFCSDLAVIGKPFAVMRRIGGTALGHRLVRDPVIAETGDRLAEDLGRELARLHRIKPPQSGLDFLTPVQDHPAADRIALYRRYLDELPEPQPVLEWVIRRLEQTVKPGNDVCLIHCDFRTGNYMVEDGRLTGILDWEFAGWGDPYEDIGWFCARCWRFGSDREAGGIGSREAFFRGYESESGKQIARDSVPWWEVMATVRWAVIALQQGMRHISGEEPSLELALTGRRIGELELDMLMQLESMGELV
ncbi:MAG: phosphotransferase family protein [Rhodospirillales bacterium]